MKKISHFIWVKIYYDDYYKLVERLNKASISFFDTKIYDKYIIIKITLEDYLRLKKYLISYKIEKNNEVGLFKIINIIRRRKVFIISLVIGVLLLLLLNNMVIRIDILTNDLYIKKIVSKSLDKYNLKVLTFKKDHFAVEKIVNKIVDENKDYIEWLEIRYDGMKMIVEVTKKEEENNEISDKYCNVISKSDAKIISFTIAKGESIVKLNQYVNKGDILVSGLIKNNEEIKNVVCAQAEVYGEVWYKVRIEVPFNNEEYIKSGKKSYNLNGKIDDKNYKILKSKYKKSKDSKEILYKLNDFQISLVKEEELKLKRVKLTEKEAFNKGLKLVDEKIKLKLSSKEEILEKKVLKKVINDSTMVLDIFVVTKENIAKQISMKEVELDDTNGTKNSNE